MSKTVVPASALKEFTVKHWIALATLFLTAGLVDARLSRAQSTTERPRFEVASIKLNKDCDSRAGSDNPSPDRLTMVCRPLRWYIELAYAGWDGPHQRLAGPEVLGGPKWIDADMYDISAKAAGATPYWLRSSLMLQALLEDRFQVKVRTEGRETSVYALTVIRNDPRLKHSAEGSCTPMDWDHPPQPPSQDPAAMRAFFASSQKTCGSVSGGRNGPNAVLNMYGVSMADFAGWGLPARVGRPVVDRTALTGLFDIHLEYSPDTALPQRPDGARPEAPVDEKPRIFQALQDQLGLKLTPDKAPIEVIVIDRAERPSEN